MSLVSFCLSAAAHLREFLQTGLSSYPSVHDLPQLSEEILVEEGISTCRYYHLPVIEEEDEDSSWADSLEIDEEEVDFICEKKKLSFFSRIKKFFF